MKTIYAVILLGFILYFFDDIKATTQNIKLNYQKYISSVFNLSKLQNKKLSLKTKVSQLTTDKKENFIVSAYSTMSNILLITGEDNKLKSMRIISALCGAFGIILSLYLKSYMLVPILGIGLALLPMWLTKFKAYKYNLRMQGELSVVLSMVTNSYIRCENILKATEENLPYINEPVRSLFSNFVYNCKMVNSDVAGNITVLRNKIDNHIFKLWCDNLIMCQSDINQKYSLNAVVEQFSTDKELYNMLSAEIAKPMQLFITIVFTTSSAFPLSLWVGEKFNIENSWEILFGTFTGQCIVIGYVCSILFGINRAINLSTTIDD